MHLPPDTVKKAELEARLETRIIRRKDRVVTNLHYPGDDSFFRNRKFYQCRISCEGRVVTETATYTGHLEDIEEWPKALFRRFSSGQAPASSA